MVALNAKVGDELVLVNNDTNTSEFLKIVHIKEIYVPRSDLFAPYTLSTNIIVNGLHGSCQSMNDASEYFLSAFDVMANYMSPKLP